MPQKNSISNKRRLAKSRSSLFARLNKKHETRKSNDSWRAKQYLVPLGRHKSLIITRRKFRTSPAKRTKTYKQFILTVNNYPFPVREISFRLKSHRRRTKRAAQPSFRLRPQLALPIIMIVIGLGGTLFFGLQAVQSKKLEAPSSFTVVPTTPAPTTVVETKPKVLEKSEPKQVRITRLGIDYPTIPVGKLADETMETPPVLEKVTGWYKYSPTPGELGPSVIVGHVDSYKGPSVFWRLREVVAGDIIEVTRADGKVVSFKVDSLKQFDQANFPTEEVYGNIDHAGLRLITCGGTFNKATGHYTENTVVYATLVL